MRSRVDGDGVHVWCSNPCPSFLRLARPRRRRRPCLTPADDVSRFEDLSKASSLGSRPLLVPVTFWRPGREAEAGRCRHRRRSKSAARRRKRGWSRPGSATRRTTVRPRVDHSHLVLRLHVGEDPAAPRVELGRCLPRRRAERARSGDRPRRRRPDLPLSSETKTRRCPGRRPGHPGTRPRARAGATRPVRLSIATAGGVGRGGVRRGGVEEPRSRRGRPAPRSSQTGVWGVEHEQLPRVHVRDVEPVRRRVEARVVEAVARSRQGHVRDQLERHRVAGGVKSRRPSCQRGGGCQRAESW